MDDNVAEGSADEDPHMGSEYADARNFLTRGRRPASGPVRRRQSDPQTGSNDSDFGVPDQTAD